MALNFQHKVRNRTLCALVVDQLPHYRSPVGLEGVHKRLVNKGYKLAEKKSGIGLLIGGDHYYDIVDAGCQG